MKPFLVWVLRLVPAVIIGQTLFFKFTGAEESRQLFRVLTEKAFGNGNLESVARLGTGVIELIVVGLLLSPKLSWAGALLAVGTMFGAVLAHIFFLGFAGINGQLAVMAAIALVASLGLFAYERTKPLPSSS